MLLLLCHCNCCCYCCCYCCFYCYCSLSKLHVKFDPQSPLLQTTVLNKKRQGVCFLASKLWELPEVAAPAPANETDTTNNLTSFSPCCLCHCAMLCRMCLLPGCNLRPSCRSFRPRCTSPALASRDPRPSRDCRCWGSASRASSYNALALGMFDLLACKEGSVLPC